MSAHGELQQEPDRFNDTAFDYPHDGLVHELFAAQARRTPNALAIVGPDQQLTYAQLNDRANRIAHALQVAGVGPESCVGLYAPRSVDAVVGMLAALKAGGAYVPLDPNYPRERLTYMLADSAPAVVLASRTHAGEIDGLGARVIPLDSNFADDGDEVRVRGVSSRSLAYVIYTSGSTGRPKGVMIEHRSILRLVMNSSYAPIAENDCVAHCSSTAFDAATWELWATLLNGARLVVVPHAVVMDPREFNRMLIAHRVTVLWLTIGLFNAYADALEEAFARMKYVLTGGDVLNPRTVARVLGKAAPPQTLISAYGPTETTTFATTFPIPRGFIGDAAVPIGRPIGNTTIHILDEHRRPVPVGSAGEICIGGPGVARGYMNQPERTAERFIADPFSTADDGRLYCSGDLGRWRADGNIEFIGRNDNQVKIRGFRVEPGELQAVLQRFPGVTQSAVTVRSEGDGQKRLIAYVVPVDSGLDRVSQSQLILNLRAHLKEQLPSYMLPAAIVPMRKLPLNSNGKVDSWALPAPSFVSLTAVEHVHAQGETEIALARLWEGVLHVEQVGRSDNFLELGGDSLTAMSLVVQVADELGAHLSVDDIFRCGCLSELAAQIDADVRARQSGADSTADFDDNSL
jgi:amino acid adenylation domain-containing protein